MRELKEIAKKKQKESKVKADLNMLQQINLQQIFPVMVDQDK